MSDYIKISAAVISACLLISFFRDTKREFALALSLVCGVCAAVAVLPEIRAVFTVLGDYALIGGDSLSYFKILLKGVGISVICELTRELCIDNGNRFLASCAELAARAGVLVLSLPLLNSVIKIIVDYIGK